MDQAEEFYTCSHCKTRLPLSAVRSRMFSACPTCAEPITHRPGRGMARKLELAFVIVLCVGGAGIVAFFWFVMQPLLDRGEELARQGAESNELRLMNPMLPFEDDDPPDDSADAVELARLAKDRERRLQIHQVRERAMLEALKRDTDWQPGRPLWSADFTCSVGARLAFSPDGNNLAGIDKERAFLWDVRTGKQSKVFASTRGSCGLVFSPDGKTLATFGGKCAQLWDIETGDLKQQLMLDEKPIEGFRHISGLAFSPDGLTLASVIQCKDITSRLRFWNPVTGQQRGSTITMKELVDHVLYSPDGSTLICHNGSVVLLRDAESGKHKRTITTAAVCRNLRAGKPFDFIPPRPIVPESFAGVAFSPDGETVAVAIGRDYAKAPLPQTEVSGVVSLWNVRSTKHLRTFEATSDAVGQFVFSPDGGTIIATSMAPGDLLDRDLTFWDLATGKEKHRVVGIDSCAIDGIALSPGGLLLATASDNCVRIWETADLMKRRRVSVARALGEDFDPAKASGGIRLPKSPRLRKSDAHIRTLPGYG